LSEKAVNKILVLKAWMQSHLVAEKGTGRDKEMVRVQGL
jgi:hypothetical protein